MFNINELHHSNLGPGSLDFGVHSTFSQELNLLSEELKDQEQPETSDHVTDLDQSIRNLALTQQQLAAPPAKSRKRKAPTLHESDWAPYRNRIIELHILANRPLKEVREAIEKEFGFCAVYVPGRRHNDSYVLTQLHV
jgi:hypothetical protein